MIKFFFSLFSFNGDCLFVEYGAGLPSHSVWVIPGTWEEA